MRDKLDSMIDLMKVLNDRTRLEIIEFLMTEKKKQKEIETALKKSQSTISQQLKILIQSGIVNFDQKGVEKEYYIKESKIYNLLSSIFDFATILNKNKSNVIASSNVNDILGVQ